MSNKLLAAFIIAATVCVAPAALRAQDEDYIVHTIKHGEVPAVLAKKYNVPLADLTSLNKWTPNVVLHVGDKVKLPIWAHMNQAADTVKPTQPVAVATPAKTATPEEETEGGAAPKRALPVPAPVAPHDTASFTWHVVEHGEVPSVLAKKYNVSIGDLRQLNKWSANVVLHVGEKVKLPAAAHNAVGADSTKPAQPVVAKATPPIVKAAADTTAKAPQAQHTDSTVYTVQKKETLYAISKKYNVKVEQIKAWNHLAANNISDGQKLVIYTSAPVATPPIVTVQATKQPTAASTTPAAVQNNGPAVDSANTAVPAEGYFASSFGQSVAVQKLQTASGFAMTFKTASGWTDKKYYILVNDVNPGSIVKVTNSAGQSVYAKVLWNMGDAKENEGLNFRISDAAAAVLGLKDLKFQLTVAYYQ